MRFVPNGADIPQDLVRHVSTGEAIFLCGAGVSCRAGLPGFKQFAARIYEHLGENLNNEPFENAAFKRGEYDRALRSLEKRTHQPGRVSRVRKAVAELLASPAGPYSAHESLLRLSLDPDGRSRLLTTNFDTLFERAAHALGLDVHSHAGKSLPDVGRTRDHGVLHLHGRLGDPTLGLEETDLVLTSADFGAAYLRDGWASRYIEDRMRLGSIVLIGYSADDAAMRLLLESLDANRDRFPDLKAIYALDKETADSASNWRAKGIEPIEFRNFDTLYQTIDEWTKYSANPDAYVKQGIAQILSSPSAGNAP